MFEFCDDSLFKFCHHLHVIAHHASGSMLEARSLIAYRDTLSSKHEAVKYTNLEK